jgi:hypothetical protein
MMNASLGETPQITGSYYNSSSSNLDCIQGGVQQVVWPQRPPPAISPKPAAETETQAKIMANDKTTRRIVQVFIADPNENVPLEKSVLYTGEPKLTDLNDTELFFEVPIQDLLKKHNEVRKTVVDKEASKRAGKDILLDPVKIRDLRMVVVTVAQF